MNWNIYSEVFHIKFNNQTRYPLIKFMYDLYINFQIQNHIFWALLLIMIMIPSDSCAFLWTSIALNHEICYFQLQVLNILLTPTLQVTVYALHAAYRSFGRGSWILVLYTCIQQGYQAWPIPNTQKSQNWGYSCTKMIYNTIKMENWLN